MANTDNKLVSRALKNNSLRAESIHVISVTASLIADWTANGADIQRLFNVVPNSIVKKAYIRVNKGSTGAVFPVTLNVEGGVDVVKSIPAATVGVTEVTEFALKTVTSAGGYFSASKPTKDDVDLDLIVEIINLDESTLIFSG